MGSSRAAGRSRRSGIVGRLSWGIALALMPTRAGGACEITPTTKEPQKERYESAEVLVLASEVFLTHKDCPEGIGQRTSHGPGCGAAEVGRGQRALAAVCARDADSHADANRRRACGRHPPHVLAACPRDSTGAGRPFRPWTQAAPTTRGCRGR